MIARLLTWNCILVCFFLICLYLFLDWMVHSVWCLLVPMSESILLNLKRAKRLRIYQLCLLWNIIFWFHLIFKEDNCTLWRLGEKEWDIEASIVVLHICMLNNSRVCLFFHSNLEDGVEWEILAKAYYQK